MTLQRNQYTPFILHYSHKIIVKWAVTQLAPIVAPYYRGGHRLVTAAGLQRAPTYWRCAHLLRDGGKSSILDGFFFWSAGLTEGNAPTWEIIFPARDPAQDCLPVPARRSSPIRVDTSSIDHPAGSRESSNNRPGCPRATTNKDQWAPFKYHETQDWKVMTGEMIFSAVHSIGCLKYFWGNHFLTFPFT